MNSRTHDRFSKNVKQVGTHGQDPLDPRTHEGRGDDKATTCANTAGDEARTEAYEDRYDKDCRIVKCRRVGLVPTQNGRKIHCKSNGYQQHWHDHQSHDEKSFPTFENRHGCLIVPLGMGYGSGLKSFV